MDVNLSPELEAYVKAAVDSGGFQSVSDVVSAALELLERQQVKTLQPKVDPSLQALTRGQGEQGEAYVETPTGELEESQEDERSLLNRP